MGLILKIAGGVIIGLLVFQIIIFQQHDDDYLAQSENMHDAQDLKNKHIMLTNAIHSYYRKNKALPIYISDLKCIDIFNTRQRIPCASVVRNGVFYVNHKEDWASAEPYVLDRKVYNKCATTRSFAKIDKGFRGCEILDINSIPAKIAPPFNCSTTSDEVEKIICLSDRMISTDARLASFYTNLLSISPAEKHQQIKDDQANFYRLRSQKCSTSECINTMTTGKLKRLELLGVRKIK